MDIDEKEKLTEIVTQLTLLANEGRKYRPRLILHIKKPSSNSLRKGSNTIRNVFPDKPKKLEEVKEEMPPKYSDGSFRIKDKEIDTGLLEYRFYHDGKRYSVYGYSKTECYDLRTDVIKGKKTVKALTLGEWVKFWIDTYKKPINSPKHIINTERYINNDILPALGAIPLIKLKGETLQAFINSLTDTPNKQQKIGLILNDTLEKAHALGKIPRNPFKTVEKQTYYPEHMQALQYSEQIRVLESISDKRYKQFFWFCCCTGVRFSEALGVKVEHIDFERKVIKVIKKRTRTKGGSRDIPFLPPLFDGFELKGEYLFDLKYNAIKTYFTRLFLRLKMDCSVHHFRHTFISVCHHVGMSDKRVQLYAGHSSIKTTWDTYTHLLDSGQSPIRDYIQALKESVQR